MEEGQEEKREEYLTGLLASSLLLGLHDKKRVPQTNQPAAEKLLAALIEDNKKLPALFVTEESLKAAGVNTKFWEGLASKKILRKKDKCELEGPLNGKTVFIIDDEIIAYEFLMRLSLLAKPAPSVKERNHPRS